MMLIIDDDGDDWDDDDKYYYYDDDDADVVIFNDINDDKDSNSDYNAYRLTHGDCVTISHRYYHSQITYYKLNVYSV